MCGCGYCRDQRILAAHRGATLDDASFVDRLLELAREPVEIGELVHSLSAAPLWATETVLHLLSSGVLQLVTTAPLSDSSVVWHSPSEG